MDRYHIATAGNGGKKGRYRLRPHAAAPGLANLWLAGDWTQTGLPATIEGAIRSGETAANLANL